MLFRWICKMKEIKYKYCLDKETEELICIDDLNEEAIKYYDKAKELDPDRLQSNWGYNRYNAYYNLYGADDPKTKQAEADSK